MKNIVISSLMLLIGVSVKSQVNPEPLVISVERMTFSTDSLQVYIPALINFNHVMKTDTILVKYQVIGNYSRITTSSSVEMVVTSSEYNSEPFIIILEDLPEFPLLKVSLFSKGELIYDLYRPIPNVDWSQE